MAFLQYGTAAGLAKEFDWKFATQNLQDQEQLDRQARIDAENKAIMLGEKFKFGHANNEWDSQQLTAFTEAKLSEIGKFTAENPDFVYDVGKWATFSKLTSDLENNDILSRSMRYDRNRETFQKFIAENPDATEDPAIQLQLQEMENYNKTGSVDGVLGSNKEYVFRSPDLDWDPTAQIGAVYSKLALTETYDKKGVGIGATKAEVPEAQLYATASSLLNGRDKGKYMRSWNAMSEADRAYYNNDPARWVSTVGKGFTATEITAGTVFKPDNGSGSGSGGSDGKFTFPAYYRDIETLQPGQSTYTPYAGALSGVKGGKFAIQGELMVPMKDENGNTILKPVKGYAGQTVDAINTGKIHKDPMGIPMVEVQVKVPATRELVSQNLLADNSSWHDWYEFEPDDYENSEANSEVASMEKGPDGKNTGYVFITTWQPANVTTASVRDYEDQSQGQTTANKNEGLSLMLMEAQSRVNYISNATGEVKQAPDGTVIKQVDGQWWDTATGEQVIVE